MVEIKKLLQLFESNMNKEFIFNTYQNTFLQRFDKNNIELITVNNDPQFKILIGYDGNLISKKLFDENNNLLDLSNNINVNKLNICEHNFPNIKDLFINLEQFPELNYLNKVENYWKLVTSTWNNYVLYIFEWPHNYKVTYIISDKFTKKIISLLITDFDFKLGSHSISVYLLNNKHILIHNNGDICSNIIIKNLQAYL